MYLLHRDQKLDFTSNYSPQRYQLLLHNVDTDLGRQATIPTYTTIHVDLWLLAAPCQHRLWTESYHPDIHDTRGPVTACNNISTNYGRKLPSRHTKYKRTCDRLLHNTDYGRKRPSWHTKYKRTCDRLLQYKLPNFAWNSPTKVGATTWTLNTKRSTAKYSHQ